MYNVTVIDVWNIDTFDGDLRRDLDAQADDIRNYIVTSRHQCLEHEASDHTDPLPANPYTDAFNWVTEHIMGLMEVRTIRDWHYTRQTDAEIDALRRGGIYLSSLNSIQTRFAAQAATGAFTQEVADCLFADSPYQSAQIASRSDKFWMISHPVEINDSGVKPLLASWGGESAYFWQRNTELKDMLKRIGQPLVLEIAMPLVHSRHSYSAAVAVIATYGRMLGCQPDAHSFDLYTQQPLGREHIIAINSQGEPNFDAIARGYPSGFVNVNLNRWDEN